MPEANATAPTPEQTPPKSAPSGWERPTLFVFGTFFFVVLLFIAWFDPTPSKTSWFIYICVLALAAGGVAGLLPGAINVNLKPGIKASGALAIAALVFYFGKNLVPDNPIVQGLTSTLEFPATADVNPWASDVYVYVDNQLAGLSLSGPQQLSVGAKNTAKATVQRGSGGLTIQYAAVSQGSKIWVVCKDSSGSWWTSNDVIVPKGDLAMSSLPAQAVMSRVEYGE